jgi:hypothetical protein
MKKLFIVFGIVTMTAFASCSNSTETSIDDSTIMDSVSVDTCANDSTCKDSCSKETELKEVKTVGAK